MKKENKYYTPTPEEFHIGFEFEELCLNTFANGPLNRMMKKTIITGIGIVNVACELKNDGFVRVKHLDREDIESFGFVHYGRTIDDWYKLEGNFEIPMSNHRNIQIRLQHDFRTYQGVRIVGYEYSHDEGDSETLYRGSCKNKSELKRILTQIGVI
jgi:hypothetical protein